MENFLSIIPLSTVKYAANLSFITTLMIAKKAMAMTSVTAYIYISYDKIPRLA
jgi:hypothetical protein